jgi:hypothetical protein
VSRGSRELTEWLNKVTGGTTEESGFLDISPEDVDHMIKFIGGGTGRFFMNAAATGESLIAGELPELEKAPFLRSLMGRSTERSALSDAYGLGRKARTNLLDEKETTIFYKAIGESLTAKAMERDAARRLINEFTSEQAKMLAVRRNVPERAMDKAIEREKLLLRRTPEYIRAYKRSAAR